jgi:flagellar assembly protein FliH
VEQATKSVTPVKFLFDTAFDAPKPSRQEIEAAAEPEPEAEAPEVYTADDLEAAREQGYARGLNEGAEQAGAAIEAQISRMLEQLGSQMTALTEEAQRAQEDATGRSTGLALAIAKKLAGTLTALAPMAELEAMIATCLNEQQSEPRVVIRVSDQLTDPVKQRLDDLARKSGFMGDLVLMGDAALSGSACRVEWADGGAERDPEALELTIDSAVRNFVAASFPSLQDAKTTTATGSDAGPASERTAEPSAAIDDPKT